MDEKSKVLDKALDEFVVSLIPSDEFIREGTQLVEKIVNMLKTKSKFSIDRHLYAGSIGKSTEIMIPDYDITVFVNNIEPPFNKVFQDFDDVLKLAPDSFKIDTKDSEMKITKTSLQFKLLESGVEIDLVVAANFVNHRNHFGSSSMAEEQRREVMERILRNPSEAMSYSGSLSETQLEFMKQRSSFIHSIVRLGKFWSKTLYLGEASIYGLKPMLEVIAVSAGEKEEGRDKSILRGFMKFLDDVTKLDRLKLAFKNISTANGPRWDIHPISELELRKFHRDPSEEYGFSRGTLVQENFIMEPGNPYNNLAIHLKNRGSELAKLKSFAKVTMDRLRWAVDHPGFSFLDLFRPMPTALIPNNFSGLPKLENILSGTGNEKRLNPSMIIRNERIMKYGKGMEAQLKALQTFLYAAVHLGGASLKQKNQTVTSNALTKSVEKIIDEDIKGTQHKEWTSINHGLNHEDFDVTFSIPLASNPELGVVKTSFLWNKN